MSAYSIEDSFSFAAEKMIQERDGFLTPCTLLCGSFENDRIAANDIVLYSCSEIIVVIERVMLAA